MSSQLTGRICSQPTPFGAGRAIQIFVDESCDKPPIVRDRVEHRFVAGDRGFVDVVAEAGALRDDVVLLAVVGEDVDDHLRVFEIVAKAAFRSRPGPRRSSGRPRTPSRTCRDSRGRPARPGARPRSAAHRTRTPATRDTCGDSSTCDRCFCDRGLRFVDRQARRLSRGRTTGPDRPCLPDRRRTRRRSADRAAHPARESTGRRTARSCAAAWERSSRR